MEQETEEQRRARQDGTQLAFSVVLRELVRSQFPNEQIREGRRDKLRRGMENARDADGVTPHIRDAYQAAIGAIDSVFAAGRG